MNFDILLPSYNDLRIRRAIESIKNSDCSNIVRIIILDGKSRTDVVDTIKDCLRPHDILIERKDKGIFDALNFGLNITTADYIGWIGSDDYIHCAFTFEYLKREIERNDYPELICFATAFIKNGRLDRLFPAAPRLLQLSGFHLPHFSTFVKKSVVEGIRFDIGLSPVSDIPFFQKIARKQPRYALYPKISTVMNQGGVSNSSVKAVIRNNFSVFNAIKKMKGVPLSLVFCINKLIFKFCMKIMAVSIRLLSPRLENKLISIKCTKD